MLTRWIFDSFSDAKVKKCIVSFDSDKPLQFSFHCPPKCTNHVYWHWSHSEFIKRIWSVADKRGRKGRPRVQILSISYGFWEILTKSNVGIPPSPESWRPNLGENLNPPLLMLAFCWWTLKKLYEFPVSENIKRKSKKKVIKNLHLLQMCHKCCQDWLGMPTDQCCIKMKQRDFNLSKVKSMIFPSQPMLLESKIMKF